MIATQQKLSTFKEETFWLFYKRLWGANDISIFIQLVEYSYVNNCYRKLNATQLNILYKDV